MKKILQYSVFVALTACVSFIACKKEEHITRYVWPPVPRLSPVQDSLSGREFIFNDLAWQSWGNSIVALEVPGTNSFLLPRNIEVSIDSASTWLNVPFYAVEFGMGAPVPYPSNNGYIYDNNYFNDVFLFAIGSTNSQLVGTTSSVKIRVL